MIDRFKNNNNNNNIVCLKFQVAGYASGRYCGTAADDIKFDASTRLLKALY